MDIINLETKVWIDEVNITRPLLPENVRVRLTSTRLIYPAEVLPFIYNMLAIYNIYIYVYII